jgi:hypothetical protein
MTQTLRVKLNSTVRQDDLSPANVARPLLQPMPDVILGATDNGDEMIVSVKPTPNTFFGTRGGAILADDSLWIADTGHHRLLGWKTLPTTDNAPADFVIGQPDFYHEGRNAKAEINPFSLNVPTGVTACGKGLAVADAWNHRVLIWFETPTNNNQPANVVLGQSDFTSGESNRGNDLPNATSLFWCYGVYWENERLWVCDTGNRRVLMWNGLPTKNGQKADLILGQSDFNLRDENGGTEPNATSMRWAHGVCVWRGKLCVADAGNNRVMVWNKIPTETNQPCDVVLGQKDFTLVDHNQTNYFPISAGLNMPYGITSVGDWLIVADTASSRLLGWHIDDCQNGTPAKLLAGQYTFQDKGDNRWALPMRDSLCWSYGIYAKGETVLVCDSGNSRAMLWRVSDEVAMSEPPRVSGRANADK